MEVKEVYRNVKYNVALRFAALPANENVRSRVNRIGSDQIDYIQEANIAARSGMTSNTASYLLLGNIPKNEGAPIMVQAARQGREKYNRHANYEKDRSPGTAKDYYNLARSNQTVLRRFWKLIPQEKRSTVFENDYSSVA